MDPQTAANTSADDGKNSAAAPAPAPAGAPGEKATFTKEEMEVIIQDRLERQRRSHAAQADADRKKAEDARLAEQGEFKKLAETAQAEVAQLRPQAERAATLEALIRQHVETLLPTLPEALRALLPADLAIEKQYEWLIKAQGQAPKLTISTPAPGNGPNPPAAGGGTRQEQLEAELKAMRASGGYRL